MTIDFTVVVISALFVPAAALAYWMGYRMGKEAERREPPTFRLKQGS